MMKRLLTLLLVLAWTATAFSQGYWKFETSTDDFTKEKTFLLYHRTNDMIDAAYHPEDSILMIMRIYNGSDYIDKCVEAIKNDGKIPDSGQAIQMRIIFPKSYDEQFVNTNIKFRGIANDGKIDETGFYSGFYVTIPPEDLKKADYVTFRYMDEITHNTRVVSLSLAGFTKCYSEYTEQSKHVKTRTALRQNGISLPPTRPSTPAKMEEQIPHTSTMETEKAIDNSIVEVQAAYPGGEGALLRFISKNLVYPRTAQEEGVQGTVVLQFRIEKNGAVGRVEIKRGLSKDCDQAAIDVIRKLPRFTPARQQGKTVPVWFTMPVRFQCR